MPDPMFKLVDADPADTPAGRVYLDFYRLAEAPFAITPDPEFLFSASCHRQVLDKIGYAIDSRMGFVLLTGEVGTGKTTVCRTLLDRLSGRAETVYVINPSVSGQELLGGMLEDLGEKPHPQASKKMLIDRLNQRLLANPTDRPFVVVIDDAQTMTPETLEDLRLLSNLETDKRKLIQVILSGQPELLDMLADARLRQLKQRIAVHCRLDPLSVRETGEYISRRLFVAGNQGQVSFAHAATRLIHKTSGGIPRLINKICDFALTAGYVSDAPAIGSDHVKRALAELGGLDRSVLRNGRTLRNGWSASAVLVLALIAVFSFSRNPGALPPPAPVQAAAAPIGTDAGQTPARRPPNPEADGTTPLPRTGESPQTAKALPRDAIAAEADAGTPIDSGRAAAGLEKKSGSQPAPPAGYALQLGSYRTLDTVQRGVAHYRKKGVPAHWQMVANGQWYRIIAGSFEDKQQAQRYQSDHGLEETRIIHAPWTVKVLPGQPDLAEAEILKFLSEIGYDSLMLTGPAGDNEIYTGLFGSIEDAAITAERINGNGRLLAQVVSR